MNTSLEKEVVEQLYNEADYAAAKITDILQQLSQKTEIALYNLCKKLSVSCPDMFTGVICRDVYERLLLSEKYKLQERIWNWRIDTRRDLRCHFENTSEEWR